MVALSDNGARLRSPLFALEFSDFRGQFALSVRTTRMIWGCVLASAPGVL
jgi:hypothetical protein